MKLEISNTTIGTFFTILGCIAALGFIIRIIYVSFWNFLTNTNFIVGFLLGWLFCAVWLLVVLYFQYKNNK